MNKGTWNPGSKYIKHLRLSGVARERRAPVGTK